MNYIRYIVILFVILVCFHARRKAEKIKDKLPVTVDVIVAEKVHFPSSIEVNGASLSEEMIELHPEISGRLTYLNIPDGATVKKVLFWLKSTMLIFRLSWNNKKYSWILQLKPSSV